MSLTKHQYDEPQQLPRLPHIHTAVVGAEGVGMLSLMDRVSPH